MSLLLWTKNLRLKSELRRLVARANYDFKIWLFITPVGKKILAWCRNTTRSVVTRSKMYEVSYCLSSLWLQLATSSKNWEVETSQTHHTRDGHFGVVLLRNVICEAKNIGYLPGISLKNWIWLLSICSHITEYSILCSNTNVNLRNFRC